MLQNGYPRRTSGSNPVAVEDGSSGCLHFTKADGDYAAMVDWARAKVNVGMRARPSATAASWGSAHHLELAAVRRSAAFRRCEPWHDASSRSTTARVGNRSPAKPSVRRNRILAPRYSSPPFTTKAVNSDSVPGQVASIRIVSISAT